MTDRTAYRLFVSAVVVIGCGLAAWAYLKG
jgi:hypothetical protein